MFFNLLWKTWSIIISSLIRQKGESQNGVSRTQRTPNFPKNEHFYPPDTHMYVMSYVIFLMSYSQVCVCLLVSSHPHILIPSGSYVLVGILASSYPQIHVCFLLSLHPLILISFLYIILIYISQTNIYINTLKKKSCNLQYNKRIKPTRY